MLTTRRSVQNGLDQANEIKHKVAIWPIYALFFTLIGLLLFVVGSVATPIALHRVSIRTPGELA